jgi:TatD DNase family protein
MLIDTHTHLYAEEFNPDRTALVTKAIANGIKQFYLPNIDSVSIQPMFDLESQFPEHCFPMMGLHPCHVNANYQNELKLVEEWLKKRPFIGIGEIGMDLYWDKTFLEEQKTAFRTQINWALNYNYGISIHCRDAFDPLYEILTSFNKLPRAVFHCFSGNLEQANKILDLGNFKLGIGGVLTFKNGGLDKIVEHVGLEHLVLETDAPYLAPVPFRGKRNEPGYILEIAKKLAALKELSLDEVAKVTSQNAEFIFKRG